MSFNLILAPEGSTIPDDLTHMVASEKNIVERITAGKEKEVIIHVSTTEIQLLVEYRHILDVKMRAIIGLHGTTYNTIWNTYVSTMERVTLDNLRAEQQEQNDERSDAGNARLTTFNPGQRRPAGRLRVATPDEPSGDKEDVDDVGDIE